MSTTVEATTFDALGTSVYIEARCGLSAATAEVRAVVAEIDAACSRFRDDSELSTVNGAAGRPTRLGPLAATAVRIALAGAARTRGVVDPTVGAIVRAVGYDMSFDELPSERPVRVHVVRTPGWQAVRLADDGTVAVPDGVLLDLGASAKAFAVDLAARRAAAAANTGVLVSIGGDIAVAGDPPPDGWTVGVADSHRTSLADADEIVTLWNGALATSSTTVRRWRTGATDRHHLVDPASGTSAASGWRTVSVAAGTCVEANTLATWAVIRGPSVLAGTGCPYRAVSDRGRVVRGTGWPEGS